MDVCKYLEKLTGIPKILIPTTFGTGAEMTKTQRGASLDHKKKLLQDGAFLGQMQPEEYQILDHRLREERGGGFPPAADLIIDEITAHARGAVEIDPAVDTIFEIGGQDSKYISITNTHPLDFDMNKVCAAGTGSFLHELANKHGINIVGEFQEIALSSGGAGETGRALHRVHGVGPRVLPPERRARENLIAGLCYAIVHNYLNRVVGKRKIGRRVMFLGGPSLNQGVVAAFENVLGRGLLVPRHREVLGAYGAAVCLQERMCSAARPPSTFRGLESAIADRMACAEKICQADPRCHNQCKLKIYDFDGRKSVWGGECGRYEIARRNGEQRENLFDLRQEIWERHMAGV